MRKYEDILSVQAEEITYKPFHLSRNLRLVYVLKGTLDTRWVAGVHTMKAGDVEIINIDEPVCLESENGDNLTLIFEINREKAKSFCDLIDKGLFNCNTTLFYSSTADVETQQKLRDMLTLLYCDYITGINELILEKQVREIVVLIGEKCHDLLNMFTDKGSDERAERFLRIYTYMYENFDKKINLKELADREYVSQQYLSKEFNDRLNMNFKDTLEYYRVIQAVRYLVTSKKTITMISELCGFSATRYFYKHFAIYMHCTPQEFKKIYLSKSEEVHHVAVNDTEIKESLNYVEETEPDLMGKENHKGGFSSLPISAEILQELSETVENRISGNLQVKYIELPSEREALMPYLPRIQGGSIPEMFLFYIRDADLENMKQFILMAEEAAISAYSLCQRARNKGLSFYLENDLLDCGKEICNAAELLSKDMPLILVGIGYPA